MRYFLDTEFIENGPLDPLQLISIGIVAEDGREFYVENMECDWERCNAWVESNVRPYLNGPQETLAAIRSMVLVFVGKDSDPQFWGYYADYDWVVFCQIFGAMVDLPKGWPMYCRDLKQWCDDLGNPALPPQESTEHHALNDARWNRRAYEFLLSIGR